MGTKDRAPKDGSHRIAVFARFAAFLVIASAALDVFTAAFPLVAAERRLADEALGRMELDTCWQTELPCSCEQGRQAKAFVVNSLRVSLPIASHKLTPLCLVEIARS